jgi:hypothetical protein
MGSTAAVTPIGQLPFFIEFLKLGYRFEPWVDECPLDYTSNNASKKIEEEAIEWLQTHLQSCYEPLLTTPWILDVDVTVKPLYGRQEGAKVGYNPHKPGRPSHTSDY